MGKANEILKPLVRLTVDLSMTVLIMLAFAYHITDNTAHEWIGISFIALCIAHVLINKQWYKNLFKGNYNPLRIIMTSVNMLLTLNILVLLVSGLLNSRAILSFLDLPGGIFYRQIHTGAAHWLLVLVSIHISLYWVRVINAVRKLAGIERENQIRAILFRLLAFTIAVFGTWSFIDRDMFSKLFLGLSFDYWDDTRPHILYFAMMFSIIGLYTFCFFYLQKLIKKISSLIRNGKGGST